ncbi:hypothetical protein CTEN210_12224 [Chaetoceros tenuissimus]|uniref:G-protein coupled receptors family 1 profile domain-containing protein n=1 Tax=Chaetoceros tenuissimus TaxID=426638 RepID=A0AAD3D0W2_9STRA|nr:hypothetical protein CTEN210_12224 [Chaetoceros tenuissimus]
MAFNTKSIQAAMIIRCITAAISASASSLLIFFILIDYATTGLKSPYSRIIFGLCIADVLQSLGILLSPFAAPTDPKHIFGIGNEQSCDAIGFFTVVGSLAVPLYTLHLTYYFLKRVKYKVKPRDFAYGEEKWLHILTWLFSIIISVYAVVKGQINPTRNGASCYIASSPLGCGKDDEQECVRGEGARKTNALAVVFVFIVFIALFCVLGAFSLHVYRSEKQLQPTKAKAKEVIAQKKKESEDVFVENGKIRQEALDAQVNEEAPSPARENEAVLRYAKQAMDLVLTKSAVGQSSLYIFAFMLIYIGPIISRVKGQSIRFDEVMFWITSIFYPLGGFFNMIIYTRPKVKALKKVVPELSNFMAFLAVLVSGGETPNVMDIMETSNENNDNTPSRSHNNSRLDRLQRALGFEERDNLYEEIENAMKEDYNVDPYIQGLYEDDGISLDDDEQDYNILGARQV